jgi:hypothetical protein
MLEERNVKKLLENILEGKISVRKRRKSWLCDVENVLRKSVFRVWRKIARDRGAWKLILEETQVLHGL